MKQTTFEEFVELSRRGTFVPVCREIMADLLTPVSAFLKIAEHSDYAFLLESVEGGEHVGRYSFLGKDPFLILRGRDGETTIEQAGVRTARDEPFIDVLRELMAEFQSPFVPDLPRFTGGAVGYLDYDAAEWFEPAVRARQAAARSRPGRLHGVRHRARVRSRQAPDPRDRQRAAAAGRGSARRSTTSPARRSISSSASSSAICRGRARGRAAGLEVTRQPDARGSSKARVRRDPGGHRRRRDLPGRAVAAVRRRRRRRRRSTSIARCATSIRRRTCSSSAWARDAIIGASPEMLVRVEGRHVETHPIAGTRRRGATPDEDQRLAEELRRNEKERAEHVMLVDLGRNDIGRVAEVGSVRVPQFMTLERYSHVMHLVSRVEGRLAEDRDRLDALVATFPAGTLTGAPKIRAMQIIGALEPTRRGLYGGAVGYLDFAGNLDFCIAIRTITMRDGHADVQAGAGIVADSQPAAEYEETRDKARALIQALEMADRGI